MTTDRMTEKKLARRGASTMMVAVVLLLLAATVALFEARTLQDHGNLNQRKRELLRAFYAAESGISQVVHWVNVPSDYSPNTTMFQIGADGTFDHLLSYITPSSPLVFDTNLLPVLTDDNGNMVGRVVQLQLEAPDASDPISSLFRIRSVGESVDGIQRTVVMFANYNDVALEGSPGAILSKDLASFGGNYKVHWGEVWAAGTILPPAESQAKQDIGKDPWLKYRSEGLIDFPGESTWKDTDVWYSTTAERPAEASAKYAADYGSVFEQNQTLNFPDYDYAAYKEIALRSGRYYATDAAGNLYRDGVIDAAHRIVSFDDEFSISGETNPTAEFIFIDTIDGNPPAADGSNLASIQIAGSGTQVKGMYYIAANIDMTGIGNPPSIDGIRPDGVTETIQKAFMDGMMIVSGTISSGGNAGAFGSLITEGGFTGTGTPDVYYNADLSDGLNFPFTSKIRVSMWETY